MKNIRNVFKYVVLLFCGICCLYSCFDSNLAILDKTFQITKSKNRNEELTVATAQQWYQQHYDPVVVTRTHVTENTANLRMKPAWENAKEHNRRRYEVVEIPIKTQRGHILMDMETAGFWSPSQPSKFIRNTAKIVIERDKKTGRTRSFMMVFSAVTIT